MKRRCRFGSRSINFSAALLAVVLAHVALLLAWPAEAPVIGVRDSDSALNLVANVTTVAIVATVSTDIVKAKAKEPKPARLAEPSPASPQTEPPLQAAQDMPAQPINSTAQSQTPSPPTTKSALLAQAPLQIPAAAQLHYTLTKGGSSANVVLNWQSKWDAARQTTSYELSLEATSGFFTILKQTSTGEITPHGLAPKRYNDKRIRKSEQATHFDAATGTVTFSNNRPQAAWQLGAQDRLSVLVQLAALAQGKVSAKNSDLAGSIWQVGERIQLPVASTDELELWQWEVQPLASDDPAGAIKLLRRPRRDFDANIEVWLSPSIGYLPSRIRQTDSSGITDQMLTRSEQL